MRETAVQHAWLPRLTTLLPWLRLLVLPMLQVLLMLMLMLMVCGISGAATAAAIAAPRWLMPALCYGAGLALTLMLAARLTPAPWWRRPTIRGIAIVAGGTWLCGGMLALAAACATCATSATSATAVAPSAPASAAASQAPALAPPAVAASAGAPFRVHRRLNLRAGPDVGARRVAVIAAGAQLTPTGRRHGDWWQVRTEGSTGQQTGWVSSLWLRQLAEDPH